MTQFQSASPRRRLPVFFLLDTSHEMAGTLQVTMHEGLQIIKRELEERQRKIVSPLIYVSAVTLAESSRLAFQRLKPPRRFEPPTWHAEGRCEFKPALAELRDTFEHDLIKTQPQTTGDHYPLLFVVLGSEPGDAWRAGLESLKSAFFDNRQPRIITLVTKARLAAEACKASDYTLLLKPAEAAGLTRFFFWTVDAIVGIGEHYRGGGAALAMPPLPPGIIPQSC